jgi:hypothetical protein
MINIRKCKYCQEKLKPRIYKSDPRHQTCEVCRKDARKRKDLQRYYSITLEEYEDLLIDQLGVCAICRKRNKDNSRLLAVDHCHETGKVRQLLCSKCNMGLGMFNDDPNLLLEAMKYLEKHQ